MSIFLKELSFLKNRTSLNRENKNETKILKYIYIYIYIYLFQNSMKIKEINSVSLMGHRTFSVIKGYIIWLSGKYFSRDRAGSPEWAT